MQNVQPENTIHLFKPGSNAIKFCAFVYGIYALFLLVECLDFLAMLHSPEPGFHATYTLVHVAFYIVDLVVCTAITLGMMILLIWREPKPATVIVTILLVTLIRAALIFYLYLYTDPEAHFVPYIYKDANGFSGLVRGIFLPLQLIGGLVCAWMWVKKGRP